MVLDALCTLKTADATSLFGRLDADQKDLMMIYVYKGLAMPEAFPSATLLFWHEKASFILTFSHLVLPCSCFAHLFFAWLILLLG